MKKSEPPKQSPDYRIRCYLKKLLDELKEEDKRKPIIRLIADNTKPS